MDEILLLLLADARTPTGGYAHSGGLEAALAAGMSAAAVPDFIRARLRTVGCCEAAIAGSACAAVNVDGLLALDLESAARTPAEPVRLASAQLGRGLLRTACTWWPGQTLLAEYRARSELTPRPVALGAVARAAGLEPLQAARVSLYEDAATVAAAAVKLIALDAAVASGWVAALSGEIEQRARQVASQRVADEELPSTSTPLLDQRALVHATTERRLFAS